ncbi:hypothetical protein AAC387_Pa07g0063 [Persea americana]
MESEQQLIPGLPDEMARECLLRLPYTSFAAARGVCNSWKQELHSHHFHRLRKSQTLLILSQAGPSRKLGAIKHPAAPAYRLTVFEPSSGSWSQLPPIPDFPDGLPLFCQVAGAGRSLVVLGGWDPVTWDVSNNVYVYDFMSATWRRGARMPGPQRSFFGCASDGETTVFVAGGHDDQKNALRSALAYDVAGDEWVPLPDMANERDECRGIFRRGRFHAIGGYSTDGQGDFQGSAECLDMATSTWGPAEVLWDFGTCPRTCVAGDGGEMFMCSRAGRMVVRRGGTWDAVAQLPADARVCPYMMMWQAKVLVIGAKSHSGPYVTYMLETGDANKYTWTAIDAVKDYAGHVQYGCCVEV